MALTDSLISYWSLDEASGNAIDAHGSNDLTDNDTVGAGTGKVNGARDFETSNNEYFYIADNSDLSTGDIDFEFQAWVNIESLIGRQMIVAKDSDSGGGANREYYLYYEHSVTRFRWVVLDSAGANIGSVDADTFGAPSSGTWYFIHAWHDSVNNLIGISVNNGAADTDSTTGVPNNGAAQFRIGARAYTGFEDRFDGLIDEVGFWKRVLTSGERTTLYNGGLGLSYGGFVPVTVTTTTLADGVTDTAYSETLTSTGGQAPITWAVTSGALPDGLTLDTSTGEISGTPTVEGSFSFTVRATDDNAVYDEQALEIEVSGPFGAYVQLDLTGMRLESVAWSGAILRASFGNGFGARAIVGYGSGLHRWTLISGGVWPDMTTLLTINGVSRFEYYWEFFKTHTTGETDIFVVEWRDQLYHASFVDTEITADKLKNMLLYTGGVEIRQRRVAGQTYEDDGSLPTPTVPIGLAATTLSTTEIGLEWEAATSVFGIGGYEYRVDEGVPVDVGDVLNTTVSGLSPATEYSFQIRSYDIAGIPSAWSAAVVATTSDPPMMYMVMDGDGAVYVDDDGDAVTITF